MRPNQELADTAIVDTGLDRAERPLITVVAVCFNHAPYVQECLNSIAAQTFMDFELIVTDDASKDNSPQLITDWLSASKMGGQFIRHTFNRGLCKTLNEALAAASGRYIAMIATDDRWHPNRLEVHVDYLRQINAKDAILYSDARTMDAHGTILSNSFICNARHGFVPPSGDIFDALADGNFIPAMTVLIPTDALRAVGGYDESLTYEDYDMWLRLAAAGYPFEFVPATLADYRILGNSLVRTLNSRLSADHLYTQCCIRLKWIGTGQLSETQETHWRTSMAWAAYELYGFDDYRAGRYMVSAGRWTHQPRLFVLGLLFLLGLNRSRLKRILSIF